MIVVNEKDIAYRKWGPLAPAPTKAVFLLVHGIRADSGRWGFFGDFFASRGYASYAIELKGYGMATGMRGHVDSFDTYYRDIAALTAIVRKEHPGKKIYLTGESMGGLITYLAASLRNGNWDGLLCISRAFKSRPLLAWSAYIDIFFSYYCAPTKLFEMPFSSEMCTRDVEYRKVMDIRAEEGRFASARMLGLILFAQFRAMATVWAGDMPTLFLVAGDDKIVDPSVSEKIFRKLRCPDKEIVTYPGMYHSLSIDLGRDKVFADILRWVECRAGSRLDT